MINSKGSNELKRLEVSNTYRFIQGSIDLDLQNIIELASFVSKCPYAILNIIDNVFTIGDFDKTSFVSSYEYISKKISKSTEILIINDLKVDDLGKNPLIKENNFASCIIIPLIDSSKECFGTICLFSSIEKDFSQEEVKNLKTISKQIVNLVSIKKIISSTIELQRSLAIKDLSSGLAHEINNPLAIIQGNLELMKRGNQDSLLERINRSQNGVDRIASIVKSLNLFTSENNKNSWFTFSEFWSGFLTSIKLIPNVSSIVLIEEFSFENATIYGNEKSLQLALFNLFKNSAQESLMANKREIIVKGSIINNSIVFEVSDFGKGIKESEVYKIFEPFYTTKDVGQGMGLGLSVVEGIVKNHKGSIKVTNLKNPTKIEISIPLKAA